jgi:hypothetical protein
MSIGSRIRCATERAALRIDGDGLHDARRRGRIQPVAARLELGGDALGEPGLEET